MVQSVEIPVTANTGGAAGGIQKVEGAANSAADAMASVGAEADASGRKIDAMARKADNLGKAAERAAQAVQRNIQYDTARLQRLQEILSRETGRNVSLGDASMAADSFETSRRARGGFKSRLVTGASDYVDYLETSGAVAGGRGRLNSYRRDVIARSLSGTNLVKNPPPGPPPEERDPFSGGVQRAQSAAMGFGKSMLALAGITSIMGMAARAADLATEESVGLDTLKRRSGDLGGSFDTLQQQVRSATEGMGLTYVESVRLAQQYARITGQFKNAEGEKTGIGFSRSFGLDPAEGVQFMATMQRYRVAGADDQGSRRLALMIGEAVSKSGYPGKADELIGAVANFATDIARQTLSSPNVADYAGYLTTLMGSGYVSGGPQNSAAILSAADQASRRGGNMGDASKQFEFAALRNGTPGLNVFQAMALMQGGLFGTTAGTFGKDASGKGVSPIANLWGSGGLKLDNVTNLQKYMTLARHMYGGNMQMMTEGMAGHFGLSMQQAAAFIDMANKGPTAINETEKLISSLGLDYKQLNMSGISGLTSVAGAHNMKSLRAVLADTLKRTDLSGADRGALKDADATGNFNTLRGALVKVIGANGQEQTDGSQTRKTIADLQNELTRVGGVLIDVLNPIRDAVEIMAQSLAPEKWRQIQQDKKDAGANFKLKALAGGTTDKQLSGMFRADENAFNAYGGNEAAANRIAPKPSYHYGDTQHYNVAMARYQNLRYKLLPQSWRDYMDGTDKMLGLPAGMSARQIFTESSYKPGVDNPKSGAMGLAQVMPETLAGLSRRLGRQLDPHDPKDALLIHRMVLQDKIKAENGDLRKALLDYGGFISPEKRNSSDAAEYVNNILGNLGNTPIPSGGKATSGGNHLHLTVGVQNSEMIHKDGSGRAFQSTTLKPFVQSTAGVAAPWTVTGGAGG